MVVVGYDLCSMGYAWLVLKQSHSSPSLGSFTLKLVRLPLQKDEEEPGVGGWRHRAGDHAEHLAVDLSSSTDLRNSSLHQQRSPAWLRGANEISLQITL